MEMVLPIALKLDWISIYPVLNSKKPDQLVGL
jgi:hypothetical protein